MNAEALVGTVLGTCTLQQLIGQGGMGAVYLAQQSRPRRQVAVKVLLPATALKPQHLAAFLERFRRETDAAASLEHPNIMPVYEYGERDGLAYLVMPYVSGGTLRDVMEREGQLLLPKIINYLEQLAAALDFAHARGVVHRDIKPANILLTPEGRLLLTDFGLVKIVTEEGQMQVRLTGAGAPVGTPDYMSPEQVMGDEVDGRADQYSLGIILFQMVTGTTPFQGETPMQIAAQQLHAQPPTPRRFRPDLPAAVEQVILKALSKRPSDRYANGLELATAFRLALATSTAQTIGARFIEPSLSDPFASSGIGNSGAFSQKGLFDPKWQTGSFALAANGQSIDVGARFIAPATGTLPVPNAVSRSTGLLSRTGMFPKVGSGNTPAMPSTFAESGIRQLSPSLNVSTGSLMVPNYDQAAQTIKLTGPVKVVQVPVAPGQYVTGLLPIAPAARPAAPVKKAPDILKNIALAAVLVLLVLGGSLGFWFIHNHTSQSTSQPGKVVPGKTDLQATLAAQASATAQANLILSDSLSSNIRNLPEGTSATRAYVFQNGAYHITDLGKQGVAVVVPYALPNVPMAYQLTMQEIRGDDTSPVNSFGMIFRYNQQAGTFYSFEVVNTTGDNGKYWFYKYDPSKANPWTPLWSQNFGSEFHEGHSAKSINTFKVIANGSSFSFEVNGKIVGKPIVDKSYASGYVGMLVNLDGTEVAFSHLVITKV